MRSLFSLVLLLAACDPVDAPPVGDAGIDAGIDAGADAGLIVGERVAGYDHSIWWTNPEPAHTLAIFDPAAFAPWPDDASFRFIREDPDARVEPADGRAPYRDFLRARGFVLERSPLDGVAFVITGHDSYHLEENGGGDFAWDLVRVDESGATYLEQGLNNEDHLVFGAPLLLPTGGLVVAARDDLPDNLPGSAAEVTGALPCGTNNCVGVHLGGHYYLYLLHLRQGSLPANVIEGVVLEAGALVGEVGNSGVSFAPHLHLSLLWYDEDEGRSWSIPSEFADVFVSAGADARFAEFHDPQTGERISSSSF